MLLNFSWKTIYSEYHKKSTLLFTRRGAETIKVLVRSVPGRETPCAIDIQIVRGQRRHQLKHPESV